MSKRWAYINDMGSHAQIMNLDSGETKQIFAANVKDKSPIGLRFGVLQETSSSNYEETGEIAPATLELLMEAEDAYHPRNSWNYDWPHYETELSDNAAEQAGVQRILEAQMAKHPFDFKIIGLQKRMLWYFSDGDEKSQKRFEALIPSPDSFPYRKDGSLRKRYRGTYSSLMRDAKAPIPKEYQQLAGGGLRPMLFRGPAYAVRFLVDNQITAYEHCVVYVMPDGTFICSDWCQRHDFSSYGGGINLQMGIYTFDSWVVGPCIMQAQARGGFKPKGVTIKREAVRELMKRPGAITKIPTIEEALIKAEKQVKKPGAAATDVVLDQLVAAMTKAPKDTDGEIVGSLLALALANRAGNKTESLKGVPILVPQKVLEGDFGTSPIQYAPNLVPALGAYRFVVGNPATPGCGLGSNAVCLTAPAHSHWNKSKYIIDVAEYKSMLEAKLDQARGLVQKAAAIDPGPITQEALAEALAKATKIGTQVAQRVRIERMTRELTLASVKPTTYQHDAGKVTCEPQADQSVKIHWPNNLSFYVRPVAGQKSPYEKFEQSEAPFGSSKEVIGPVNAKSSLETVVKWYFNDYVKSIVDTVEKTVRNSTALSEASAEAVAGLIASTALSAASAAVGGAASGKVNPMISFIHENELFRVLPEMGGKITLERYGNTGWTDKTVLVRRSNGHVYEKGTDGWTVVSNEIVKAAAQYFYKVLASGWAPVVFKDPPAGSALALEVMA